MPCRSLEEHDPLAPMGQPVKQRRLYTPEDLADALRLVGDEEQTVQTVEYAAASSQQRVYDLFP